MNQKEKQNYYELFLKTWGENSQINMCIEEMSELIKALCKYNRFKNDGISNDIIYNIKEEIADVLNMAEQLQLIFGVKDIEQIREEKLLRTLKRIKENESSVTKN